MAAVWKYVRQLCVSTKQIHPVEKARIARTATVDGTVVVAAAHATVDPPMLFCPYNCAGALVGNATVKQLPFPGVDSTVNLPPSSEVTMR